MLSWWLKIRADGLPSLEIKWELTLFVLRFLFCCNNFNFPISAFSSVFWFLEISVDVSLTALARNWMLLALLFYRLSAATTTFSRLFSDEEAPCWLTSLRLCALLVITFIRLSWRFCGAFIISVLLSSFSVACITVGTSESSLDRTCLYILYMVEFRVSCLWFPKFGLIGRLSFFRSTDYNVDFIFYCVWSFCLNFISDFMFFC